MPDVENRRPLVLVADDETIVRELIGTLLRRAGYAVSLARDGQEAIEMAVREHPDVLLADYRMPRMDGMQLLVRCREVMPDLPVVLVTAFADIQGAIDAVRAGAHDYVAKPFNNDEMLRVVQRAEAEHALRRKLRSVGRAEGEGSLLEQMGPSRSICDLVAEVNRVARSDFNVVISGETGSGKELVARAIHDQSPRSHGPFVPVDCGAIPATLLESELFGYEKGSFTGAASQKQGKFEAASGGTIFLDEIANMPLLEQAKLLRVLQDKVVCRIGSTKPFRVDARVIAASNNGLAAGASAGTFRSDLFFRLNEFEIRVPPLRERPEDIVHLAQRFIEQASTDLRKPPPTLSDETVALLVSAPWPGNVRQLRGAVRRAVLLADSEIRPEHIDSSSVLGGRTPFPGLLSPFRAGAPTTETGAGGGAGVTVRSLRDVVREQVHAAERDALVAALRETGGNKARAARLLQVDYKTIHSKIKEYGIGIERGKDDGHQEK